MLSQPLFFSYKGWEEIYFVTNCVLYLAGVRPRPAVTPGSLSGAAVPVLPRCSLSSGGHPELAAEARQDVWSCRKRTARPSPGLPALPQRPSRALPRPLLLPMSCFYG